MKGFLSLAKANHSGTKRYGRDYYDYRMQAQKIVKIRAGLETDPSTGDKSTPRDPSEESPIFTTSIHNSTPDTAVETESSSSKQKDPLTWYGILAPPALRAAQSSFTTVVETSIPKILNDAARLRQMEIEIGRLRKSIRNLEKIDVDDTGS
jgi:hypothetical protein